MELVRGELTPLVAVNLTKRGGGDMKVLTLAKATWLLTAIAHMAVAIYFIQKCQYLAF